MKLHEQFLSVVTRFFPDGYFQKENNSGSIESLLENPQFKEFLTHSPSVVGIFNNITMGYEFLSDNIEDVFGYKKELFTTPGGVKNVLDTFKKEHADIYNTYIFPLLYEYFQKCSRTNDIEKYRFTSPFQLKRNDGNYIWCLQQIKVITTDDTGYATLLLLFITDVTDIKKDEDIDFVIACKDELGLYKNVYAVHIPPTSVTKSFSKRELDILFQIKKGLSTKEIAEKLIISKHTVNTHRKNILKKHDGMNMMEIVQMMGNKKFI
jgi:DNA-binding CsgD family transcriptional regulator